MSTWPANPSVLFFFFLLTQVVSSGTWYSVSSIILQECTYKCAEYLTIEYTVYILPVYCPVLSALYRYLFTGEGCVVCFFVPGEAKCVGCSQHWAVFWRAERCQHESTDLMS